MIKHSKSLTDMAAVAAPALDAQPPKALHHSVDAFAYRAGNSPAAFLRDASVIRPLRDPKVAAAARTCLADTAPLLVITGGPGAGKTTVEAGRGTAIPSLKACLAADGVPVVVVEEAAREEIALNGLPLEGPGGLMGFNQRVTTRQVQKEEDGLRQAQVAGAEKALVVCDRGPPDNLAFLEGVRKAS